MPTRSSDSHDEERRDELIKQLNQAVETVVRASRRIDEAELSLSIEIESVKQSYSRRLDTDTTVRDDAMRLIADIVQSDDRELIFNNPPSKSIDLRAGRLSLRMGTTAVEIDDEEAAMASIRRGGMLRLLTRVGKRTIDKAAVRKLAEDQPERMNLLRAIEVKAREMVTVTPHKNQGRIEHKSKPTSRYLR